MNLHCKEMDLWQTPTPITYMCYSNKDGGWKGIRYRYEQWVRGHLNGAWNSETELENMKSLVIRHIEELYSHKKLRFYVM